MAEDTSKLPEVGDKKIDGDPDLIQAGDEPEGHEGWKTNMEHYAKRNEWVGYAMHCYQQNQASAPSATNEQIPDYAEPAKKKEDAEMQRMQRDDAAVNYSRIVAELSDLKQARESDRATIAALTAERDREQCERMVKQLQLEGYQLKVADEVPALLKKSPAAREEYIATIKRFATPIPTGQMIEVYSGTGFEGGEKAKPKTNALDASQAAKAARYAQGDNKRFEKARSALLAGQPLED
jgi:hypothetical protein